MIMSKRYPSLYAQSFKKEAYRPRHEKKDPDILEAITFSAVETRENEYHESVYRSLSRAPKGILGYLQKHDNKSVKTY